MLFFPFFLTFLALSFSETFGKCLAKPSKPTHSPEADGIFKRLSKMHASPALPSPSSPILNFYFCFAHTTSLSLSMSPPTHTHTPHNKQTHTRTADLQQKSNLRTSTIVSFSFCCVVIAYRVVCLFVGSYRRYFPSCTHS